ncbi:MAG: hypothetical protein KTR31_25290 [Myxococcales bacterium]|nr:hypothetical protein [Myxococcales bacterium]
MPLPDHAISPLDCGDESDVCEFDSNQIAKRSIDLLSQEAEARGARLRLPFIPELASEVRPDEVGLVIEEWSEDCLDDGDYLHVRCDEYPCVVAFATPVEADCLESLGAAVVMEVEGRLMLGGGEIQSNPLFVGVFRDVNDVDLMGKFPPRSAAFQRARAIRPFLDEQHGEAVDRLLAGKGEKDVSSFTTRTRRVHINAFLQGAE